MALLCPQGSHQAAQHLRDLDIFTNAQVVKVDPDKPLEGARLLVLQVTESVLTPPPTHTLQDHTVPRNSPKPSWGLWKEGVMPPVVLQPPASTTLPKALSATSQVQAQRLIRSTREPSIIAAAQGPVLAGPSEAGVWGP